MSERLSMAVMAERLARLESEQAIRACMNRYMTLCDQLDASTPLDELAGLFVENAIWEGVGEHYRKAFGQLKGRQAIRAMLAKYAVAPAHFALNVHFLTSEQISVAADGQAVGNWVMLQTSTFATGESHLNAARLTVDFICQGGIWRMAHFRTENLFSRPVDAWLQDKPLPVPK